MSTEKNDPYLTTKIVKSYLGHNTVRPDQLSDLITSVHQALGQLGQPVQPEEVRTPAVSVRRSVHRDYVVCLDCGYRGQTLRRHISARHGLGRDEYLQRWGLRSDYPHRSSIFRASIDPGEVTWSWSQARGTGNAGGVATSSNPGRCRSGLRCDAHTETQIPFSIEVSRCRE